MLAHLHAAGVRDQRAEGAGGDHARQKTAVVPFLPMRTFCDGLQQLLQRGCGTLVLLRKPVAVFQHDIGHAVHVLFAAHGCDPCPV